MIAIGWLLLGLSVWALLQGVLREPPPWSIGTWMHCTGSIALAYVAGFLVVVVPAALGVREYFLTHLLAFASPARPTLDAAVIMLRLTWTAVEVIAAAVLLCLRERYACHARRRQAAGFRACLQPRRLSAAGVVTTISNP